MNTPLPSFSILKSRAAKWRKKHAWHLTDTGGCILFWAGKAEGWSVALPNPADYRPGSLCLGPDDAIHIAQGGNDQRGAREWVSRKTPRSTAPKMTTIETDAPTCAGAAGSGAATEVSVAAIMDHDGTVYSVPRPGRHHDVIRLMLEKGRPTPINGEQGFVLSDGSFARRKPAARIAIKAGQIKNLRWPPNLYSEDLW